MIRLIRYEFIKQFCKRSILALLIIVQEHIFQVRLDRLRGLDRAAILNNAEGKMWGTP